MPKESILVIDDEKDLLKLLQYNLQGEEVIFIEEGKNIKHHIQESGEVTQIFS